ncbi:MAG: methyltransferase [Actinomycetota bacterium]
MRPAERRLGLDEGLADFRYLWHPQPFREIRPAWCNELPALADELMALPDEAVAHLNNDGIAALEWLARHVPEVDGIRRLAELPAGAASPLPDHGAHWAWEIPGRKREQIEAFAAAAVPSGGRVFDWCGGKGHLGRLLALNWQVPATSLDIDATLCAEGRELARRAKVEHDFLVADALAAGGKLEAGHHLVALHACGDLHRTAVQSAAERGVAALDVAPCCYFKGVEDYYQPLSAGAALKLSRDDIRLAVTETVTASPRQARRRDLEMAWKLGFDALRRAVTGGADYKTFKPVPSAWFSCNFGEFLRAMAEREELVLPPNFNPDEFEATGWQRQWEVMRLSIVRHAFRRAIEVWLALDLAVLLEQSGYEVRLGTFCPRHLTPRNLLLSARR